MSDKNKEHFLFMGEPVIDVVRRCADVAYENGKDGKWTRKGIDENGLDLLSDFVHALGLTINIGAVKIDKEEPEDA